MNEDKTLFTMSLFLLLTGTNCKLFIDVIIRFFFVVSREGRLSLSYNKTGTIEFVL